MTKTDQEPPDPDEIEVSVFGPGFGEAIAIHIGEGRWILIDSCQESDADTPASIEYLKRLDVELQEAVKLVVATHWHDDHVRGISKVVNTCTSALFVCSAATSTKEFRHLAAIPEVTNNKVKSSSFKEMGRVFRTLYERGNNVRSTPFPKITRACANRHLFKAQIVVREENVDVAVFALSPSDADVSKALTHFSTLASQEGRHNYYVPPLQPNHSSVVIWVQVGNHHVLLGGDLEVTDDPDTGWLAVFDSLVIPDQATMFKISHHGSENGDHDEIWAKLLAEDPIAVLTPYRLGGNFLPRISDIVRLLNRSPHIYITAPPAARKSKWRGAVKDIIDEMTTTMTEYYSGWGHVRLRQKITASSGWHVELFGDARRLVSLQTPVSPNVASKV